MTIRNPARPRLRRPPSWAVPVLAALLLAVPLAAQSPAAAGACTSTATGDLRTHRLESRLFGNTRTIRVLLPDDYGAPQNATRRYPVLYLLDGQNLFDACLSEVSKREWQVDETARRLIREGRVPPLIIVGIDHAGADRAHEFLPYRDPMGGPPTSREPAGKQWPAFVFSEVMPLVDSTYRTHRGWEHTGLGGSSYGGIATLHALAAAPGLFGRALIESAPLWVGMGQVVRDTDPLATVAHRVWVATGATEAGGAREIHDLITRLHRRLEANFRAAGYDATRMRLVLDPASQHTEDAWAARFPEALEFLWRDWTPPAAPPR